MPGSQLSMNGKVLKTAKFDELNELEYTVPIKSLSLERETVHYHVDDSVVTSTETITTDGFSSNSAKIAPLEQF